jgi:UDP-3-O-acyl-N-acetylglucosamine deacetylase
MSQRASVAETIRIDGLGLHSGARVQIRIHPSDQGIAFRYGHDRIPATPSAVTGTRLCTRLGPISTVEHLLGALAGMEITDAEIEVSAPEIPGLDGSAAPFVAAIQAAGTQPCGSCPAPPVTSRIHVREKETSIRIGPGTGRWTYTFDTGDRWPGRQTYTADLRNAFPAQVAPARTIAVWDEIPGLRAAGMGRGLDEHSVVILGPGGYDGPARFPDEPARHKLLDLMGDLYLAGVPLTNLDVCAWRSGHRLATRAAALLQALCRTAVVSRPGLLVRKSGSLRMRGIFGPGAGLVRACASTRWSPATPRPT